MNKNNTETAVKAEKKSIETMNLAELRKERHHIAAKISSKKKAGKDVTELKAQEQTTYESGAPASVEPSLKYGPLAV